MTVSLSSGDVTGIDEIGSKPSGGGFVWTKPLTAPAGDHGKCSIQGVLQLDPPKWANSLTLHLKFVGPDQLSFNLGDSPTNNGYGECHN